MHVLTCYVLVILSTNSRVYVIYDYVGLVRYTCIHIYIEYVCKLPVQGLIIRPIATAARAPQQHAYTCSRAHECMSDMCKRNTRARVRRNQNSLQLNCLFVSLICNRDALVLAPNWQGQKTKPRSIAKRCRCAQSRKAPEPLLQYYKLL